VRTSNPTDPSLPSELTQPVANEDHRRYARKQCRLHARVHILQTWDVAFGPVREFDVVVRNISRTGICFVYFRQLYPDDRVTLDFGDLLRHYRVARCRRLTQNCYEIGLAVCSAELTSS
jgi:hypothetical protein